MIAPHFALLSFYGHLGFVAVDDFIRRLQELTDRQQRRRKILNIYLAVFDRIAPKYEAKICF